MSAQRSRRSFLGMSAAAMAAMTVTRTNTTCGAVANDNIHLFHKCITNGDYTNATVPSAVDANLACLLNAYAGRAGSEMTWDQLLANEEKMQIDTSGLID